MEGAGPITERNSSSWPRVVSSHEKRSACRRTASRAGSAPMSCRQASASELETLDMARRAIHDRAARHLLEALEGKVETDFATARRLLR